MNAPRLLRAVTPGVVCRACGVPLPDPIFRVELGHGAVVCEDCEKEINDEIWLTYPDWFDQPLPADQETKFGPAEELAEAPPEVVQISGPPEPPPNVPADIGDWLRDADANNLAVPVEFAKRVGELMAAANNIAVNAFKVSDRYEPTDAEMIKFFDTALDKIEAKVTYCEECKADHREHERCPFAISRKLNPPVCVWCVNPVHAKGQTCFSCTELGPPVQFYKKY